MDDIKETAIAAAMGVFGTLATALGVVFRSMWKSRAAETERLRERDDAQWEALEAENTRLRDRVEELESDRDAKLARLEAAAQGRHEAHLTRREREKGVRSTPGPDELAEADLLGSIARARVESAPDSE